VPLNSNESPAKRLEIIKSKIAAFADQYDSKQEIQLLAVSKTQPAEVVSKLHKESRHVSFGENYIQELEEKATQLKHLPIEWHFIGKLQSNKISRLVEICKCIQTVESEKHARYVAKYAKEFNKAPFPIYIAVNAGQEAQKSGVPLSQVPKLALIIEQLPELKLEGIMAIPPVHYSDENYEFPPELYQQLAALAKTTGKGKLSLGMSQDLKLAIQSGSSYVRIGRAIFGERL